MRLIISKVKNGYIVTDDTPPTLAEGEKMKAYGSRQDVYVAQDKVILLNVVIDIAKKYEAEDI